MLQRLLSLQVWGRPFISNGRTSIVAEILKERESIRQEIDALSRYYLGHAVSGCMNCYADALIQLCLLKTEKLMERTNLFIMKRGKVLKDIVGRDSRLNLVRGNETEELALYHLYTNPEARQFFERLPDEKQLDEMLTRYGEQYEAKRGRKYGGATETARAEKIVAEARAEAKRILKEAKVEAKRIVAEAKKGDAGTVIPELAKDDKVPGTTKDGIKSDPIMD